MKSALYMTCDNDKVTLQETNERRNLTMTWILIEALESIRVINDWETGGL